MKIPLPYKIILKRLYDASYKGKIELRKAKIVITFYSRIPKQFVTTLLKEMEDNSWIEFENRSYLLIKERVDCDVGSVGQHKYLHWTLK